MYGANQLCVLLGKGDGTFAAEATYPAPAFPGESNWHSLQFLAEIFDGIDRVDVGDFNGDQKLENGNCKATVVFACSGPPAEYKVVCTCPAAKCDCLKNGVVTRTVAFRRCPGCGNSGTQAVRFDEDSACGFR